MSPRTLLLTALTAIASAPHALYANEADEMVVRVYPVADLVRSVPDYPYQSGLPTVDPEHTSRPTIPGAAAGGAQGAGGFGGGGGGGFFQIGGGMGLPMMGQSPEVSVQGIIDVIQMSIAPDFWQDTSGKGGTISGLGTSLVVRQTPPIQTQIAPLLDALRQQDDRQKMLTVRALVVALEPGDWDQGELALPAKDRLKELEHRAAYSGQLTCFSGQQVHLASGHVRNVVTSLIPVVSAFASVYQPIIAYPHVGTLLEFTPSLDPRGDAATLDIQCTVTEWNEGGDPVKFISEVGPGKASRSNNTFGGLESPEGGGGRTEGTVDRINMGTRQLATTVRVPVSKQGEPPVPVIVGTLGRPSPAADQKDGASELTYLIVAVSRQ